MKKKDESYTVAIGILAIVVAILAVGPPGEWAIRLNGWTKFLVDYRSFILLPIFALLCVAVGFLFAKHRSGGTRKDQDLVEFRNTFDKCIVSESDFAKILDNAAIDAPISRIDLISYTSETFSDMLKYDVRNRPGVAFRFLLRDWHEESLDEEAYNKSIPTTSERRHWKKSKILQDVESSQWPYVSSRKIRFYSNLHPLVRVIMVTCGSKKYVYFSLYDWQESPPHGGSPFKGTNSLGCFLVSTNPDQDELISRLEHQFEFIWDYKARRQTDRYVGNYKSVFSDSKAGK